MSGASAFYLFFVYFYLLFDIIVGLTSFDLGVMTDDRYQYKTFKCLDGDDCFFNCSSGSVGSLSLPSTTSCYDPSGYSTYTTSWCGCHTITCSDGSFNCNTHCSKPADCLKSIINCGDGGGICNIYCYDQHSCAYSTINCGDGTNCNLYCNGYSSCKSLIFNCGKGSNCTLQCNAYGQNGDTSTNKGYECYDLTVNAQQATSLSIDVYNDQFAAANMEVYAPNTPNGSPSIIKCGINSNDISSNQYSCDAIKIHSVEGWNDVKVTTNYVSPSNVFQDYTDENQEMYCGLSDQYFCYGYQDDNNNEAQCHDKITICNNATSISKAPTSNPTKQPSGSPSKDPSKTPSEVPSKTPSGRPTNNPLGADETASPSKTPTQIPSENPTKNPLGADETGSPSTKPSYSPSGTPSNVPTSILITETHIISPTVNESKCDYIYDLMQVFMIISLVSLFTWF